MVTIDALLTEVEDAFETTGHGLSPWTDPHPDRSPEQDEYSRVSDPWKWRIVGARADAWAVALERLGLAKVERDTSIRWSNESETFVTRTDRVVPRAHGALAIVVARSRIESVDDAGLTLGVGDPAFVLNRFPDCGCDACDSGSQHELEHLDQHFVGVVTGRFRRLSRGRRQITALATESCWTASGRFRRGEVDAVLADPSGWDVSSGTSWLASGDGDGDGEGTGDLGG